jgi:3-oxoacyl-[acyl-carrier protein] reductase
VHNVIVTGASRGLGLAIATTLAGAGYRVIAIARSPSDPLTAASRTTTDNGVGAIEFRPCDLSDIAQLPVFVRELRAEFGCIYGLVNNAASGTPGVLGLMRDQDIERVVRLNSLSPMVLTKYVLRSMMTARSGRIVNITSIVASTGYSGLSVYSATKASLVGFTQSLAREVGQLGITVNAIAPGFMETDMTDRLDASQRLKITRRSALRRLADPLDVARSVEFLLGDSGRNITGVVLTVDAGATV